jgi:hypothetical protein
MSSRCFLALLCGAAAGSKGEGTGRGSLLQKLGRAVAGSPVTSRQPLGYADFFHFSFAANSCFTLRAMASVSTL